VISVTVLAEAITKESRYNSPPQRGGEDYVAWWLCNSACYLYTPEQSFGLRVRRAHAYRCWHTLLSPPLTARKLFRATTRAVTIYPRQEG